LSASATEGSKFFATTPVFGESHYSLGRACQKPFCGSTNFCMLITLTRLEKRIVAVLALLIVLGLVGMSVL